MLFPCLLFIALLLLLSGCQNLFVEKDLHPKCAPWKESKFICDMICHTCPLKGYYYNQFSNTCTYVESNNPCAGIPFSDKQTCEQFCVENNPAWELLTPELTEYFSFFQLWASTHKSYVFVNGIDILAAGTRSSSDNQFSDITGVYKNSGIARAFQQSTCDPKTFNNYFSKTIYPYNRQPVKTISKEQLQTYFQCLGTFTFKEDKRGEDAMKSWFDQITNQSGVNRTMNAAILKKLERGENLTQEEAFQLFGFKTA
jgi:hypothetical protein